MFSWLKKKLGLGVPRNPPYSPPLLPDGFMAYVRERLDRLPDEHLVTVQLLATLADTKPYEMRMRLSMQGIYVDRNGTVELGNIRHLL